jgi:hypothetical protein
MACSCSNYEQGPLLMQSVLSPIIGRLSDVLDRKYLAGVPPLIALVGAVVCTLTFASFSAHVYI